MDKIINFQELTAANKAIELAERFQIPFGKVLAGGLGVQHHGVESVTRLSLSIFSKNPSTGQDISDQQIENFAKMKDLLTKGGLKNENLFGNEGILDFQSVLRGEYAVEAIINALDYALDKAPRLRTKTS